MWENITRNTRTNRALWVIEQLQKMMGVLEARFIMKKVVAAAAGRLQWNARNLGTSMDWLRVGRISPRVLCWTLVSSVNYVKSVAGCVYCLLLLLIV